MVVVSCSKPEVKRGRASLITSPDIVFDSNGVAFDGSSLKVTFPICVQEMTDHGCVALRIHIPKAIKPEQNNSGSILKYKCRPEVMKTFTDILSSEGMKETPLFGCCVLAVLVGDGGGVFNSIQ